MKKIFAVLLLAGLLVLQASTGVKSAPRKQQVTPQTVTRHTPKPHRKRSRHASRRSPKRKAAHNGRHRKAAKTSPAEAGNGE